MKNAIDSTSLPNCVFVRFRNSIIVLRQSSNLTKTCIQQFNIRETTRIFNAAQYVTFNRHMESERWHEYFRFAPIRCFVHLNKYYLKF